MSQRSIQHDSQPPHPLRFSSPGAETSPGNIGGVFLLTPGVCILVFVAIGPFKGMAIEALQTRFESMRGAFSHVRLVSEAMVRSSRSAPLHRLLPITFVYQSGL